MRRTFDPGQLCIVHSPHGSSLGEMAYSSSYVYVIYSGEAKLLCTSTSDSLERIDIGDDQSRAELKRGKHQPITIALANRMVENVMGSPLVPIASLSSKECITVREERNGSLVSRTLSARTADCSEPLPPTMQCNLLSSVSNVSWCLLPTTTLEVLFIPRKDWMECLRPQGVTLLTEIAKTKGAQPFSTLSVMLGYLTERCRLLFLHLSSLFPRSARCGPA